MAKDPNSNYVVALPGPSQAVAGAPAIGSTIYGNGAPTFTPFPWQATYIDEQGGHIYTNNNGAWTLKVS